MKRINYQGRQIAAEMVNVTDGCLVIATRDGYAINHEGREELWRDASGQYYLRRALAMWDVDGCYQHRATGEERVHRISLTAAAQWATMRCWAETHHLRRDIGLALRGNTRRANAVKESNRFARKRSNFGGVALLSAAVPSDEQKGGL